MQKKRCATCNGSGRMMGGGMILTECDICDGKRYLYVEEKTFEIDKESKHYKDAIKKIKALSKDMTDEKAEEIFMSELKTIESNNEVKTV